MTQQEFKPQPPVLKAEALPLSHQGGNGKYHEK